MCTASRLPNDYVSDAVRQERKRVIDMSKCDQCGNEYASPMTIGKNGKSYTFDSFECAITYLAPTCAQCGTRVVGHGLESDSDVYCCAHCARQAGVEARA